MERKRFEELLLDMPDEALKMLKEYADAEVLADAIFAPKQKGGRSRLSS